MPQLGGALAHQLILSRDDAIALLCITVCVIALIGMACASARRLLASATVVLVISVGALVFGGPFIGIAPSSTHHNMYSMTDDSSNIINGSSVSSDLTLDKTIASGVLDLTHAPATISSKDVHGLTMALDVIPNNLGAFVPGEKCGMANNWTHSINRNISCVCIPLFDTAAAPARTRRDSPHPNVGELQRECAAIMSLPGQHSTTLSVSDTAAANDHYGAGHHVKYSLSKPPNDGTAIAVTRHLRAPLKTTALCVVLPYSADAVTVSIDICNVEPGAMYLGLRGLESEAGCVHYEGLLYQPDNNPADLADQELQVKPAGERVLPFLGRVAETPGRSTSYKSA